MKNVLLTCTLALFAFAATAQTPNEKYTKVMEKALLGLDTLRTVEAWQEKSNTFERIGQKESAEWLPAYYVALCQVMIFNFEKDVTKHEPLSTKADRYIAKADSLQPNNSEVYVVKSMAAGLHIRLNPMANGQKYGTLSALGLEKAKTLDAENPRTYLEQGMTLFFTPEQWGGDKVKAKELLELAGKKFETFKPASTIHPNWGLATYKYIQELASKEK